MINTTELAARLREKRFTQGLTLRQAARAVGISHTTLSRVMRGTRVPDRESLLLLAKWLNVSVEELIYSDGAMDHTQPESDQPKQGEYTPETVARLLRADRRLKPADVEVLMMVFRTMYDSFSTRNEDDEDHENHDPSDLMMPPLSAR